MTNENYYNQYLDNAYVNPTASSKYNSKFRQKITRQQTFENKKVLGYTTISVDEKIMILVTMILKHKSVFFLLCKQILLKLWFLPVIVKGKRKKIGLEFRPNIKLLLINNANHKIMIIISLFNFCRGVLLTATNSLSLSHLNKKTKTMLTTCAISAQRLNLKSNCNRLG